MPSDRDLSLQHIQKADQIAYKFFLKFALVIHNARVLNDAQPGPSTSATASSSASGSSKADKWVRWHYSCLFPITNSELT